MDISRGETDFATWANLGYAVWVAGANLIDNVLKVNYRNPFKPAIIIPYVTGYYLSIGSQGIAQYRKGWIPWAIMEVTCLINIH